VHNSSAMGRVAATAAVLLVLVAAGLLIFSGGSSYTVSAVFENASQLVPGDLVQVSGIGVGTVSDISLTPTGQADVKMSISNSAYEPLHVGTLATIRSVSLSGVANRYVDLTLGPQSAPGIANDGRIAETSTTSEVDLDQLFDTLNAPTRLGLQNLIQGTASQYAGKGAEAQAAFEYLNPAVSATSMLFSELNHNTASFTKFVTSSGHLLGNIASRQAQLSGVISNLSQVTSALAAEHDQLGTAISDLPGFMRLADTTFVNLRSSLNTITPLVNDSKPVAPKLEKLLIELRPLAYDSVPTIEDLSYVVQHPGVNNDLIDLARLGQPLAAVTVDSSYVDGKERRGAFPESTVALTDATPELAFARPYAVDLTGWFEGFSHPGGYDANGGFSRVAPVVGVGSINNGLFSANQALLDPALRAILAFGGAHSKAALVTNYGDRCPGSMEHGSIDYYPGEACSPDEVPAGK
jgi:phospholipid/cholesterol/gamma-HCH transport system substrate-binding protein